MKRTQFLSDEEYLDLYLREIANCQPVNSAEEARLAKRIQNGDRKALDKLVKANLRFVVSVARNYQNQGMALGDLINEGNLGLIRAAKRFDETKNFKFISYAVWWIRQAILQSLAEQSRIVNLPLNKVGIIHRIGKTEEKFYQKHHRLPGTDEIAYELQVAKRKVEDSLRVGNRHVSLDMPVSEKEETSLIDLMKDKRSEQPDLNTNEESLKDNVNQWLNVLETREKEIIRLYYGLDGIIPHTLDEIGSRFNLTRERVRQVKKNGLKRLRTKSLKRLLRDYASS
ncbi:MAG: sigma-70 family RNA polymerase sigma factor [Chitinivibrionales bacterium]|nr:sigma-70 family RNA polymerase sigma factor [Chitinivibrionales bacterium]